MPYKKTPTKRIPADLKVTREGDYFLITVPNYWGRGASLEEAKRELSKAGGDVKGRWRVYSVHPETYVGGLGGLCFKTGHEPQVIAEHDPQ